MVIDPELPLVSGRVRLRFTVECVAISILWHFQSFGSKIMPLTLPTSVTCFSNSKFLEKSMQFNRIVVEGCHVCFARIIYHLSPNQLAGAQNDGDGCSHNLVQHL